MLLPKRARGVSRSEASGPTVRVGSATHTLRPAREAKLWREGLLLDCEVHVEGRTFKAHRLVLVSSSEYMRGCFCSGLSETASASVTLEDMPSAVFEALLTWMYDAVVEVEEALASGWRASRGGMLSASVLNTKYVWHRHIFNGLF